MTVPAARSCLAVLLAAGEGTRMRSALPKPLHAVAGRSMLAHAIYALGGAGVDSIAVVVGPNGEPLAAEARKHALNVEIFVQSERRGTGHAVLAAREALARPYDDVVVTYADIPLVSSATIAALRAPLAEGFGLCALGFEAADPSGYGRFLEREGALIGIREHKDATAWERAITRCNAGPMAFLGARALEMLEAIGNDNAAGEFYLTDLVEIATLKGSSPGRS